MTRARPSAPPPRLAYSFVHELPVHDGLILQPTYRVRDGIPVVQLYGRLASGEAFLVEDDRYRPYFFASVEAVDRRRHIEQRLREALDGDPVAVEDESHLHAGHAGARGGAGHFRALVVSPRFRGVGRVERQRMVYAALAAEMGPEIHALSMQTLTPEEWREREG